MKLLLVITLLIVLGCSTGVESPEHPSGLKVSEVHPSKWTYLVKQNLLQLAQVYDLSPFLFTKTVQVESKVIPTSHPVLTLNTRFAENTSQLLAIFLNQQFQLWLAQNQAKTTAAILELKRTVPHAPETKSLGKDSTYIKMLAAELELLALTHYLGKTEARRIITEKITKHKQDPWIYKIILARAEEFNKILRKNGLLVAPLI